MSICEFCGKETSLADSCIESHIVIDGVKYRPIPYQAKARTVFEREPGRCPGCNVKPGGFHHVGCELEICPKCKYHWIYCRCSGIKVKINEPINKSDQKCKVISLEEKRKTRT